MNNYVDDRSRTRRLYRSAGCCFSQDDERGNEALRVVEASTGPVPRSRRIAKRVSSPQNSNQDSRRNLKSIETNVSNGPLVAALSYRLSSICSLHDCCLQRRGPCDKKKNIQVFKLSNNEHVKGNRINGGNDYVLVDVLLARATLYIRILVFDDTIRFQGKLRQGVSRQRKKGTGLSAVSDETTLLSYLEHFSSAYSVLAPFFLPIPCPCFRSCTAHVSYTNRLCFHVTSGIRSNPITVLKHSSNVSINKHVYVYTGSLVFADVDAFEKQATNCSLSLG